MPLSTLGLSQFEDFFNDVQFIMNQYNTPFGMPHIIFGGNLPFPNVPIEPIEWNVEASSQVSDFDKAFRRVDFGTG